MKQLVYNFAREHGHIQHDKDAAQVYLDLALEAIAKRKELKEILILKEAHIRFRWAGPLKLQVFYKKEPYFIRDEESGLEVLHHLHLSKPQ